MVFWLPCLSSPRLASASSMLPRPRSRENCLTHITGINTLRFISIGLSPYLTAKRWKVHKWSNAVQANAIRCRALNVISLPFDVIVSCRLEDKAKQILLEITYRNSPLPCWRRRESKLAKLLQQVSFQSTNNNAKSKALSKQKHSNRRPLCMRRSKTSIGLNISK